MVCETKLHDLVLEVTDGGLEGSLLLIAVADPDNMIGVAKWSFENIFVLWSGAKAAPSSGSRYLLQSVQIVRGSGSLTRGRTAYLKRGPR